MDNILNNLSKDILSGTEISKIFNNPKDFPVQLIEQISLKTAILYIKNQISFEDGYCVMNNLYSLWVTNDYYFQNFVFGKAAWVCFEAFDRGGYYSSSDSLEINPAETYTKPLIEKLLKEKNLL